MASVDASPSLSSAWLVKFPKRFYRNSSSFFETSQSEAKNDTKVGSDKSYQHKERKRSRKYIIQKVHENSCFLP